MLGNELLNLRNEKNFMFDQWLAIRRDIIEITAIQSFLENRSDVCNFAKLVDFTFPSTNETSIRYEFFAILVHILADWQSY